MNQICPLPTPGGASSSTLSAYLLKQSGLGDSWIQPICVHICGGKWKHICPTIIMPYHAMLTQGCFLSSDSRDPTLCCQGRTACIHQPDIHKNSLHAGNGMARYGSYERFMWLFEAVWYQWTTPSKYQAGHAENLGESKSFKYCAWTELHGRIHWYSTVHENILVHV
jgi:hypothetical protein